MNERIRRHQLAGTAVYIGMGLLMLFMQLMPINPGEPGFPGPDVMLCITCAWVLRRPDQLPAVIIVAMVLIGDFMLGRPFGLWSLLVLVATELLRPRAQRWTDQAFVFEWLRVSVLIGLMLIGYRVLMVLFLLPVPALGSVMLQCLATVAAYPAVVLMLHLIGVRRLSAAEIELMGH